MSLSQDPAGTEADTPAPGWRFAVTSVATRRTLALATAFAAALGLLPLYEAVWWWDLLTHALAGAAITGWLVLARWRVASVLLVVAALSGAWEVLEHATPTYVFVAGEPADTAVDVLCNFAGSAAVVAAFDRFASDADGEGSDRSARRAGSTTAQSDD